jgi:integrase
MAIIEPRHTKSGEIRYRARVRRKGQPHLTATFLKKTDAQKWVTRIEADHFSGKAIPNAKNQQYTIDEALNIYIPDLIQHIKDVNTRVPQLFYWQNKFSGTPLNSITAAKIRSVLEELRKTRSNATANRYLAALSAFFTFVCRELEWIENNPCQKIRRLPESRGRCRILSDLEKTTLINTAQEYKQCPALYPIIMMAITTGMRKSEILRLRWEDIKNNYSKIIIKESKNGETRSVPLVGPAKHALIQWSKVRPIDQSAMVFPPVRVISESTLLTIHKHFKKILQISQIKDFRFHDLRHTSASYLAMSGIGLRDISDILGHKTLAMVQRYSHLTDDHKHQSVSRMVAQRFGERV